MDRSITPIDFIEFVFCLCNPEQGEEVEKLRIFLGRVTNASPLELAPSEFRFRCAAKTCKT